MLNLEPTQLPQIQANQRGQFSPEQRSALEGEARFKWLPLLTPIIILPIIFSGIFVGLYLYASDIPLVVFFILAGFFLFVELLALIPQVFNLINNIRARSDLNAGQIEVLDGQCAWRRNKYVLETPSRRLKFMRQSRHLMPGSYRFYFLPNTGFLLSAERMVPPGGEDPRAELLDVLEQVHHFRQEDLEANRQGRLSLGQIAQLIWKTAVYTIIWLVLFGFGLFVAYAVFRDTHNAQGQRWVIILSLAGVALLLAIYLWIVGRLLLDAVRGQIANAQGLVRRTVTVTHTQYGASTTYYYKLDKLSFTVSSGAYTAFIDGLQYRLYYAPLSKTLLAIEPL